MKVSVIIVNYNGKDFIGECVNSVLASHYQSFEIIVVDNASTDGSWAYLTKKYKENKKVRLIKSDKQLFFTGGANWGAKEAQGDKLFFLNSDTVIDKNCIKKLVDFSKGEPKYLVQPKILFHRQNHIIDNVGGRYNFFGFGFAIGRGEKDKGQYDKNFRIDYANATAFVIDKDFFWKLRGFDERFKYFYEDVDLSLRAKKRGGECWYCHKALIYHKGSLTFKQNVSSCRQNFYIRRNRLLTLLKNDRGPSLLLKLLTLVIISIVLFVQDFIKK